MNNEIRTQVHTIILLIGPSGSGKSTFAKNVLIPQLSKPLDENKNFKPNIQYISSDEIRQDIIGLNANKFDNIMTESSEHAFKLLFTKLDVVSSYPINAEFIIIDTTGLSEEFRNQIHAIAEKNNYNVDAIIFDYKKVEDYKQNFFNDSLKGKETSGKIIADHMKRLRTDVLPSLRKHKYKNITKIKSKDFIKEEIINDVLSLVPQFNTVVWDWVKYESRILPKKYDWVTIGDVHGCVNEFKELIAKYGFIVDGLAIKDTAKSTNIGLIFVGDIVDKASDEELEELIRIVHFNMTAMGDRFHLVLGNHEEMVWKWITNSPSLEITPVRIAEKDKYYKTVALLEKNEELKNIFLEIFNNMKGWVKTIGSDKKSFIVTHAPCEIKYLEKMDNVSLAKQYKCASRSKNRDKTNDEITPYLMLEAVKNHPTHIFGHMGQTNVRSFKNKVCIDTGCAYGFKLTGYTNHNGKPFIQSVSSMSNKQAKNDFSNDLFSIESNDNKSYNIDTLSEDNQNRLNYIIDNGIGYIGGTISPADKDVETGKLESLKAGLDYYRGKVDKVVLQPKYMGSRAQIYLNKNIEKCYATSRNGYKIKLDLLDLFKTELIKHEAIMTKFDLQEITIDGELMPWAAIGKGLIEQQFITIDKALESEIDFLKNNGFDESFNQLVDQWKNSTFEDDKHKLNKKELQEQYGHKYNNFKLLYNEANRWQPSNVHFDAWNVYHNQVEIYGSEDIIHFKPFRLLKGIHSNGDKFIPSLLPSEEFKYLNDDDCFIVDFNNIDYLTDAEIWYDKITKQEKMEGCVIKPDVIAKDVKLAPYLKVRNPDYLTIIYGYDMYFPKKYEKLFTQKNINKKIKVSITEYKIGEEMLKLDLNTKEFKQQVAKFMFEYESEKGIDPRL